jgi:hypothetical protein
LSITLGGTPRSGEFSRVGWLLFGWERPADAKGGGSGPPNPAATPPHMSRACRKRKARDPSRAAGSGRSAVLTGGRSDPRNRAHRNLARPSCRTEVARGGGRVLPPLPLDGRTSAAGIDEDVGEDVRSRGVSEQKCALDLADQDLTRQRSGREADACDVGRASGGRSRGGARARLVAATGGGGPVCKESGLRAPFPVSCTSVRKRRGRSLGGKRWDV